MHRTEDESLTSEAKDAVVEPLILTTPALEELHALVNLAYSKYSNERFTFSAVTQSLQWTRKRAHRTGTVVLGMFCDDALAGTLSVLPYSAAKHNRYIEKDTDVCLEQFAVHPNYQRRGFGASLMAGAEHLVRRSSGRRAFLDTPTEAEQLRNFYQRLGYSEIGEYQPFESGQKNTIYVKHL